MPTLWRRAIYLVVMYSLVFAPHFSGIYGNSGFGVGEAKAEGSSGVVTTFAADQLDWYKGQIDALYKELQASTGSYAGKAYERVLDQLNGLEAGYAQWKKGLNSGARQDIARQDSGFKKSLKKTKILFNDKADWFYDITHGWWPKKPTPILPPSMQHVDLIETKMTMKEFEKAFNKSPEPVNPIKPKKTTLPLPDRELRRSIEEAFRVNVFSKEYFLGLPKEVSRPWSDILDDVLLSIKNQIEGVTYVTRRITGGLGPVSLTGIQDLPIDDPERRIRLQELRKRFDQLKALDASRLDSAFQASEFQQQLSELDARIRGLERQTAVGIAQRKRELAEKAKAARARISNVQEDVVARQVALRQEAERAKQLVKILQLHDEAEALLQKGRLPEAKGRIKTALKELGDISDKMRSLTDEQLRRASALEDAVRVLEKRAASKGLVGTESPVSPPQAQKTPHELRKEVASLQRQLNNPALKGPERTAVFRKYVDALEASRIADAKLGLPVPEELRRPGINLETSPLPSEVKGKVIEKKVLVEAGAEIAPKSKKALGELGKKVAGVVGRIAQHTAGVALNVAGTWATGKEVSSTLEEAARTSIGNIDKLQGTLAAVLNQEAQLLQEQRALNALQKELQNTDVHHQNVQDVQALQQHIDEGQANIDRQLHAMSELKKKIKADIVQAEEDEAITLIDKLQGAGEALAPVKKGLEAAGVPEALDKISEVVLWVITPITWVIEKGLHGVGTAWEWITGPSEAPPPAAAVPAVIEHPDERQLLEIEIRALEGLVRRGDTSRDTAQQLEDAKNALKDGDKKPFRNRQTREEVDAEEQKKIEDEIRKAQEEKERELAAAQRSVSSAVDSTASSGVPGGGRSSSFSDLIPPPPPPVLLPPSVQSSPPSQGNDHNNAAPPDDHSKDPVQAKGAVPAQGQGGAQGSLVQQAYPQRNVPDKTYWILDEGNNTTFTLGTRLSPAGTGTGSSLNYSNPIPWDRIGLVVNAAPLFSTQSNWLAMKGVQGPFSFHYKDTAQQVAASSMGDTAAITLQGTVLRGSDDGVLGWYLTFIGVPNEYRSYIGKNKTLYYVASSSTTAPIAYPDGLNDSRNGTADQVHDFVRASLGYYDLCKDSEVHAAQARLTQGKGNQQDIDYLKSLQCPIPGHGGGKDTYWLTPNAKNPATTVYFNAELTLPAVAPATYTTIALVLGSGLPTVESMRVEAPVALRSTTGEAKVTLRDGFFMSGQKVFVSMTALFRKEARAYVGPDKKIIFEFSGAPSVAPLRVPASFDKTRTTVSTPI